MAELSAELLRLLVHHVEVNYGNIDIRHHPTNGLVLRLVPPSGGQTIEVEFRLLARIAMQNGQGTQNPSDRFVRQTSAVTKILNHLLNVAHKGRSTASGRGNLDKSVSPSLDNARRGSPVAPPLPPQPEEDQDTRRVIYDLLVHKYPFLATWHQGVVDNIVGAIQAGKTEVIMALLWVHTYWHKHDSVLVSMNDIGSYRQIFVRDVYQFNHWLQAQSGCGDEWLLHFHGLRENATGNGDPVPRGRGIVYLALGNASSLRKLARFDLQRPFFCMDEGDEAIKHCDATQDRSKFGETMHDLLQESAGCAFVTATPFALLNRVNVRCRTISLELPPNYRHLKQMTTHLIDENVAKTLGKQDHELCTYMRQQVYPALERHPHFGYQAVLVRVKHTKVAQQRLAIAAVCHAEGPVADGVFVYNSDTPCPIKEFVRNPTSARGYDIRYPPFQAIDTLFNHFENRYRETNVVYRYMIIAYGKGARRGTSFRPHPTVGSGGLLGMVLLAKDNVHMANLNQALRLAGKYAPEYPTLHLFTTEGQKNRLLAEQLNMETLCARNAMAGEAREQIKGALLIDVGGHDRLLVDDTTLSNRRKMFRQDFDTEEELRRYLPSALAGLPCVWMTKQHVMDCGTPELNGVPFSYDCTRAIKARWNQFLKPVGSHFQIAWSDKRYEDLHNPLRRFGAQRRHYLCQYIVGDGQNDHLYRAEWLPQFCNDELTIDDKAFWSSAIYLFRTSSGKYRFFNATCKLTTGFLAHPN